MSMSKKYKAPDAVSLLFYSPVSKNCCTGYIWLSVSPSIDSYMYTSFPSNLAFGRSNIVLSSRRRQGLTQKMIWLLSHTFYTACCLPRNIMWACSHSRKMKVNKYRVQLEWSHLTYMYHRVCAVNSSPMVAQERCGMEMGMDYK